MGSFKELIDFFRENQKVRILILDNNNLEFCSRHEKFFPIDQIYTEYDLILVPGWVHYEISHSNKRLDYLSRLPKEMLILIEEEDYLDLAANQDAKLMKIFEYASPFPTAKRFFNKLNQEIERINEIPDDWVDLFYNEGFDTKTSKNGWILRKNAGEVSILVLSFLLADYFINRISYITIGSSDYGSYAIKHKILDHLHKHDLLRVSPHDIKITFKSTDILLIEGFKARRINPEQISKLRPNPRHCIFTKRFPDGTSLLHEGVITTLEFIQLLEDIEIYQFIF